MSEEQVQLCVSLAIGGAALQISGISGKELIESLTTRWPEDIPIEAFEIASQVATVLAICAKLTDEDLFAIATAAAPTDPNNN